MPQREHSFIQIQQCFYRLITFSFKLNHVYNTCIIYIHGKKKSYTQKDIK